MGGASLTIVQIMPIISIEIYPASSGDKINIRKLVTEDGSQTDFRVPDNQLRICFRYCVTRGLSDGKRGSQTIILVDISTIQIATLRIAILLMVGG